MALPLQALFDLELLEEAHHVRVSSEKDVQPRLDPVPILVLPRRDFTSEHVARFKDYGFEPRVAQVLGCAQARQTRPRDDHGGLAFLRAGKLLDFLRELLCDFEGGRRLFQVGTGIITALAWGGIVDEEVGRGDEPAGGETRRDGC